MELGFFGFEIGSGLTIGICYFPLFQILNTVLTLYAGIPSSMELTNHSGLKKGKVG